MTDTLISKLQRAQDGAANAGTPLSEDFQVQKLRTAILNRLDNASPHTPAHKAPAADAPYPYEEVGEARLTELADEVSARAEHLNTIDKLTGGTGNGWAA